MIVAATPEPTARLDRRERLLLSVQLTWLFLFTQEMDTAIVDEKPSEPTRRRTELASLIDSHRRPHELAHAQRRGYNDTSQWMAANSIEGSI